MALTLAPGPSQVLTRSRTPVAPSRYAGGVLDPLFGARKGYLETTYVHEMSRSLSFVVSTPLASQIEFMRSYHYISITS